MAEKVISTTHELAATQWAEGLEAEALLKISVTGFMGSKSDALVQREDRLEKAAGTKVRTGLRMQDNTAPKTSGDTLEGNEKAIRTKYMDITLDEFAEAYRWENVLSRQYVTFEHREEAKAALSDLLANAWDTSFFNQIAGVSDPGGASTFEGANTINAPTNHFFPAAHTAESTITSTDTMSLDLISKVKTRIKAGHTDIPIRKCRIPGFPVPLYVCFVHPFQNESMRAQNSRWDDICNNAMQGGMISNNPLITGAMGIWDETLIVENNRVPLGSDGAGGIKVRRAIFCGAQTAKCVYARLGGTPERYRWVEKLFDYDRHMGVMGGFVAGIKKSVFEDEGGGGSPIDFGCAVISTASASDDA